VTQTPHRSRTSDRLIKRRAVIVAAIIALATGGYLGVRTVGQRAHRFRQLAQFHARRAALFQKSIGSKERAARDCEAYGGERMLQIAREYRDEVKLCVKLAAHHARLIPKYEHAAARPWVRVEADPPEPAP
jgi:hypothetical protein